jgi:hypothetical protein
MLNRLSFRSNLLCCSLFLFNASRPKSNFNLTQFANPIQKARRMFFKLTASFQFSLEWPMFALQNALSRYYHTLDETQFLLTVLEL